MKSAIESLERVSSDEKMIEIYRAREKSKRDIKSKLIYAEKQGVKKGIEQGIEQGVLKVVKNAISKGMEIKDIIDITGLTEKEIQQIKEEMLN